MRVQLKPMRHGMTQPTRATPEAAGHDVYACLDAPVFLHPGQTALVPLGFAMRPVSMRPVAAFLLPRSGLGHKHGIVLGNLVGVIDQDYTGEACVSVWNRNADGQAFEIKHGDRIGQMVFLPVFYADFEIVGSLDMTARGDGGFGSTGV